MKDRLLIPLNIAFFGDESEKNTGEAADNSAVDESGATETDNATEQASGNKKDGKTNDMEKQNAANVKTDAQRLADAMVAKKLAGMPSKDELVAYKKWLDDQKTAEQKQAEAVTKAQKERDEAVGKLAAYERNDIIRKNNVDESYIGYVSYETETIARTKDITFDEALTEFLSANKDKYKKQNTRVVTVDTESKSKEQKIESDPFLIGFKRK